jgi:hypothetical protein
MQKGRLSREGLSFSSVEHRSLDDLRVEFAPKHYGILAVQGLANYRATRANEVSLLVSITPVPVVPDEHPELFKVSCLPVADVGPLYRHPCGDPPAEFGFIRESNVQIEEAFLELVLDSIHNLAA